MLSSAAVIGTSRERRTTPKGTTAKNVNRSTYSKASALWPGLDTSASPLFAAVSPSVLEQRLAPARVQEGAARASFRALRSASSSWRGSVVDVEACVGGEMSPLRR